MDLADFGTVRLVASAWQELTILERQAALRMAREEGRRAVRELLGVRGTQRASAAMLRRSRWAREHGGLDHLPDHVLSLYAGARTLPTRARYIETVVERFCPEQAYQWWSLEPEVGLADLRVCAFCEAYERERCSILGLNPPSTGMADLQLQLWHAKEQERERARDWMRALEASFGTEEQADLQRSVARFEYQRCQWVTDLAQMLLDAAAYSRARERSDRAA